MPDAGCRTIAELCNRRHAARRVSVGKTYIHQVLQRHDYEIQILRRHLKHRPPQIIPRNRIWAIDLTGKTDANGTLHPILGIIDHGTRKLLCLHAPPDKTSRTLLASLEHAIRTHGKPQAIRTDNEAVFTSHEFRQGLKRLGVRHQRTTPGCPWQNGRVKRLFGTLKQKLDSLTHHLLPAVGEEARESVIAARLNADLNTFRHWYNHIRPHQNLNGRTPAEAWHGINPYANPPRQERWFTAWDGLLTGYDLRY